MTYCIETYGCQMNKAESQALERLFAVRGWVSLDSPLEADLILINTCSVRITAETRVYGRLAHFSAEKKKLERSGRKPFTLAVTGCMAERLKGALKEEMPGVDYVIGTFQKSAFGLLLDACEQGKKPVELEETPSYVFAKSHAEAGGVQSFVPVMHGCNNFCAYCIVPYLRGREISRSPSEILDEIGSLEDSGVREITLLGQNVNSYHYETDGTVLDFPGLLRLIASFLREREKNGIHWIRFLTSHPKDFSDELIAVMNEERLLARHVHLCVQHGSNDVLDRMNRNYTVERYLGLVDRLKASIPDVSLSTDILIGFPGETEADFAKTLELLSKVRFSNAFMYHFNPREGTPAFGMPDQIPEVVRLERLERLIAFQRKIGADVMRDKIGETCEVLVEGVSKRKNDELIGRTEREEMVVFKAEKSMIGKFVRVKIVSLLGTTFHAELIS